MVKIGSEQDLAREFGGTFVPDNSRNDGSVFASYLGCEEALEDDERVFDDDPLRHRGTVVLKVRSTKEERNSGEPRFRHVSVAGPRRHSDEIGGVPLQGQSWAGWARNARF